MGARVIVTKVEKNVIVENMMIKKFFKDVLGITAREEEDRLAKLVEEDRLEKAKKKKEDLAEQRRLKKESKLTPKQLATRKKEPWVGVVDFKINDENIRNGFFELDWNEYFIVQLKNEGYGYDGDPDEEIVERWYRDICAHVAAESGIQMESRPAGMLSRNVRKLPDNRSEIE